MTAIELKNYVLENFSVGQEVTIKITNEKGMVIEDFKANINKFYPSHVSLKHNGFIESFSYWEFIKYASKFNQKKKIGLIHEKVKRAKYA